MLAFFSAFAMIRIVSETKWILLDRPLRAMFLRDPARRDRIPGLRGGVGSRFHGTMAPKKGGETQMEQSFSERLKGYRRDKNLTQQELADLLGVSNKTVSRWESGGYPDVPLLVPLARALGVTVDDLLDGEKPIRSLSRADWQSLLSFAFALGGGVLFYLLDLFMPMVLCYCAYLGCMAYGVYLQKYYAYHSRWFQLSSALMCLAVNLTFVTKTVITLAALVLFGSFQVMPGDFIQRFLLNGKGGWVLFGVLAILVGAGGLTAVIQYLIFRWSSGGDACPLRLVLVRPPLRRLLPGLVPWLAAAFWLFYERPDLPVALYEGQESAFSLCLAILAVLGSLPLLGRGHRRWIPGVWCMTALCWGMIGLRVYKMAWSPVTERIIPYSTTLGSIYVPLAQASWAVPVAAAVLCVLWVLLQCVRLSNGPEKTEEPPEKEKERVPSP